MLPPSASPPSRGRDPESGAVRPLGVLVAIATAGAVFGVGMLVLPPIEPPAPVIVEAPPPAPPPPPAAPPPAPEPAAVDAAAPSPDGEPPATAPAEPAREEPREEPKLEPIAKPRLGPAADAAASGSTAAKPAAPPAKDRSADKEVARDAWRKNLPDVSTEDGKAAMLIPIKGSIDGATYHVTGKPRSVLITLPKGESMITMPFYAVRHDGFRQLWIKKDDDTGTSIRVVLAEASEPQVEIKDDFVRVTVRRPTPTPTPTPEHAPSSTAAAPAPIDAGAGPAPRGD
ncbi:MAG TPA: hypothetical protein VGK52_10490 [Polyangia bacterium]